LDDAAPPVNALTPRLLFVPVSGAFGMGEYARSLAIARGAKDRWPGASIQFILSREAAYAAGTPFPAELLASSPTLNSAAVIGIMNRWGPDIVIFDNSGRTGQLRAARRIGARVVYISSRRRQRNKAFRLGWMRLIDEHWIAYPEFIAGGLKLIERLKLRLLGRPVVRYLDAILARGAAVPGAAVAGAADRRASPPPPGTAAHPFLLMVPGGGTGHPDTGAAVDIFLQAAHQLAAQGLDTVFVGREESAAVPGLRLLGPLPQAELAEWMRGARLIIANGGSTLLQAIACGKACVAVPLAGDQALRIRRCVDVGVAEAAPRAVDGIVRIAADLWRDGGRLDALAARAVALGLADGVDVAVRAMAALLAG
jgi:hypothetical protein